MLKQKLYDVLETHLFSPVSSPVTAGELADQVVCDFIMNHKVPGIFKEEVLEELHCEVIEMIRMKIYGYNSILEFREDHEQEIQARMRRDC